MQKLKKKIKKLLKWNWQLDLVSIIKNLPIPINNTKRKYNNKFDKKLFILNKRWEKNLTKFWNFF